ncbi:MAG: DUF4261 domain-containing protein [Pseudomonadota bacterium]|uniref:DUF4261 domain-containing protein n=1 Tax=Sphingomonas sp. ERG5 TaxID=1381597 RepID=UPI00054C7AA7|nr:DUF4261 domain-containing protein [Sphingomonas sp. ERG5]
MPTLLLEHPVGFPIALIRALLLEQCPRISWRVGEEDYGGKDDVATLERPQTIIGRLPDGDLMLVSIEYRPDQPYRPANGHTPPAHHHHIAISRPSTEDDTLALKVAVIVCTTIAQQQPGSFLQLEAGGNWLDHGDMSTGLALLARGVDLRPLLQCGVPETTGVVAPPISRNADPPAPFPEPQVVEPEDDGQVSLASMTIMLDGDVHIDWPLIDEVLGRFDPDGRWKSIAAPGGMGFVRGRGSLVFAWLPLPMDPEAIDNALQRSFWFQGDRNRIARHRQHVTVHIKSPADFESMRMVAMVATLVIGMIAREPQVAGVFNNQVNTLFDAKMAEGFLGVVTNGEIPIQLWTWTAPDSMADGNVCLTTGGLMPFLGYEVEVWNAPYPVAMVGDKLSELLRYLLLKGPVIRHGDTVGTTAEDQAIRCFFGESRARRETPVRAMFVEFGEPAAAQPRPDPVPSPPLRPSPGGFARRPGGFGRKGL